MTARRDDPSAEKILGSLEYRVMKALWKTNPASVDDVRVIVNRRRKQEWAYTTIMTVLSRLFDKELVTRTRVGRAYEYTPAFSEPELVAHISRSEVAELVSRFGDVVLAQFATVLEQTSDETRARIAELAEVDDDAS